MTIRSIRLISSCSRCSICLPSSIIERRGNNVFQWNCLRMSTFLIGRWRTIDFSLSLFNPLLNREDSQRYSFEKYIYFACKVHSNLFISGKNHRIKFELKKEKKKKKHIEFSIIRPWDIWPEKWCFGSSSNCIFGLKTSCLIDDSLRRHSFESVVGLLFDGHRGKTTSFHLNQSMNGFIRRLNAEDSKSITIRFG